MATGIAAIPLLLVKLWSVFPLLLQWPPVKSLVQALERATIAIFVAASLLQLASGLLNTYKWYPWTFPFRQTHYWMGWVIVGSLALHIAVKLPVIARHWRRTSPETQEKAPRNKLDGGQRTGVDRRAFLATITASSALLALTTAGQSFAWLAPFNIFAPRRKNTATQVCP